MRGGGSYLSTGNSNIALLLARRTALDQSSDPQLVRYVQLLRSVNSKRRQEFVVTITPIGFDFLFRLSDI